MERDWAAQLPIGDVPSHWREGFGGEQMYRLHAYRAAGDRLRTYWRERWVFGNDSEPPYPLYVSARDDEAERAVLRRLDLIGVPYHFDLVTEEPTELTDYPQLLAPLWDESVDFAPGDEWGRGFITLDELELFFGFFRQREG